MHETVFSAFIKSMTDAELVAYAKACDTSPAYLTGHLRLAYKTPRADLMARLVKQSGGQLSRADILEHFFPAQLFDADAA